MYTVKDVATMLNINPHTVRYYANSGLIPNLERNSANVRQFTDENIWYLRCVLYLRSCGMSISAIKDYISLLSKGEDSLDEQYQLMLQQKENVDMLLKKLLESKAYIEENLKTCSKKRKGKNIDNSG